MALTDWACALAAALVTAVIAWILIPWAGRHRLVDQPCGRHDHTRPTPVVGGMAILLGVGCIGLARWPTSLPFLGYLVAAFLIVVVGLIDDVRDLSWRLRIVVQAVAALTLAAAGVMATSVGNLFELGAWSLPFSLFATIGVINAINMIDGSDGLSGTQVGIALGFFAAVAADAGAIELAAQLLLLLGGIGGFLALNLRFPGQPTARIFLGNSGSALLGLTVAWAAFRLAQTPGQANAGILAPWMIAIPLIDCVVLMGRRLLSGRSPFLADHNHIHHLLRDAGHSPQRIVAVTAVIALVAGAGAIAWLRLGGAEWPLVALFLGIIGAHFAWTARRERAVAHLRRAPAQRPLHTMDIPMGYHSNRGGAPVQRRPHD